MKMKNDNHKLKGQQTLRCSVLLGVMVELFGGRKQTIKDAYCASPATPIGNVWYPIGTTRKLTTKWSAVIHQIVLCLWFFTLFASSNEVFAKSQSYCALDKSALFLDLDLHHITKPIWKLAVINFSDLCFECADSTSKDRPALFVLSHPIIGSFLCLAPSGEPVIDVSANQTTSHTSKSESDKLWDADPYGLYHDVADIIHYFFIVLVAAVVSFFVSRRMTPNEKS
jgi:hypothetical protein